VNSGMSLAVTGCFLLCITACIPLPIPHNELVTPAVRGRFRSSSGRPAAGIAVALTSSDTDTSCNRAVVRRVTDARGQLQAPRVAQRKTIYWLVMMDRGSGIGYWLCAGSVDSLGTPRYSSRTAILGTPRGDDLDCFTWQSPERDHITCNRERYAPLEGGRWSRGTVHGTYRVVFVASSLGWDGRKGDEDGECHVDSPYIIDPIHPYVQWLAGDSIVAVTELPRCAKPWERKHLGLSERGSRWYLTFAVNHSTSWNKLGKRWVTYELGTPGEVREVPS